MVVSAPKDEQELRNLLYTAVKSGLPFSVRYPRGAAYGVPTEDFQEIEVGSWEELLEGEELVILATGYPVYQALRAAERLYKEGIRVGVVNARFIKPMDEKLLEELTARYDLFLTVEDNTVVGGFGTGVLELFARKGTAKMVVNLGVPDRFIEHGNQNLLRSMVGIDSEGIERAVKDLLAKKAIGY